MLIWSLLLLTVEYTECGGLAQQTETTGAGK